MDQKNLFLPEYYENREISWLKFNERILKEAQDQENPLWERLKFLSITASNLDEFFMIRVASLKDMVHGGYGKRDIAGMTAREQLEKINQCTHEMAANQYLTYREVLLPLLEKQGLKVIKSHEELTEEQKDFVDQYFREKIYPVLTPMAVDSSRPFPLLRSQSLNLGAIVVKKEAREKELEFATVQVPSVLSRIVLLPKKDSSSQEIILLEQIMERNIQQLFFSYHVICSYPYRITRNADMTIEEDEADDLLKEIQKQVKKRQWGEAVRLEVEEGIEETLLNILKKELYMKEEEIFRISGPLDLTFLMKMYEMEGYDHLKSDPFLPVPMEKLQREDGDIFGEIAKGDILLHHPYMSFEPVVLLIKRAAADPKVLAIKQTLYRVSGHSPIIAALAQAAENGKQVSVLVELKARFDEENNIVWAKKLEKAGCHVIYGLVGLKTHSKITLIVRLEEDRIRRYVHLGTGNYNDTTAKLYTDLGLLTCAESIGEDATAVFNMLSGYSKPLQWNKLSLAPISLREKFLWLIARETKNAKEGKKAGIIAKMNSLCDREIIEHLYEASRAGVSIELIIRGICCLKVGISGVSEHITVRSIVGEFLEHSRIYCFENAGAKEVYCSSADWMPRNLDRRIEILFPIEQENLKKQVLHILEVYLADNQKAQILQKDGTYQKISYQKDSQFCAQKYFQKEAAKTLEIFASGNS